LAAKIAKTHGGGASARTVTPGPIVEDTLKMPVVKKGTTVTLTSTQRAIDQLVADERKGAPDKEIQVDPSDDDKKFYISTELEAKLELALITFLRANLDVFAWQMSDMPVIPREVIEHKLGTDPAFKPIKQKERRYTSERCKTIRLEVNRLVEVGFIRPVDYPSWLANPVLVEKLDGSWHMCIDYTSLNKACPKDEYPLPRIC
jgi:hypothetical protein